jgi:hypothetical protein
MEGLSSRPRLTSLTLIKNSFISRALIPGTWCSHRRQWVSDFDHSPVELRRPIAAESGLAECDAARLDSISTFDTDRQRLRTYLLDLLSDRSVMQKEV